METLEKYNQKLEKYNQDLERYKSIVAYFEEKENRDRVFAKGNVSYLDSIQELLTKYYPKETGLIKKIDELTLSKLIATLNKIKQKRIAEGKSV